jgi:hypothetical protein
MQATSFHHLQQDQDVNAYLGLADEDSMVVFAGEVFLSLYNTVVLSNRIIKHHSNPFA